MPTKMTLEAIWPHIIHGGGIVVDDCILEHWANGSLQAYAEFIMEHKMPFVRVGGKAGALVKDLSRVEHPNESHAIRDSGYESFYEHIRRVAS